MKLLYIDLFCGAGGTSTGIELARQDGIQHAKVIACVNHDANAIASHASNHPDTLHFIEDIRTLELAPLVDHLSMMKVEYPEALVVLWASLECTNFSKAKGGQPRDADSRTLAEHLFRYIEAINPDYIQIENVEEFMSWGDLDENGKPISRDAGRCYRQWVSNVNKHGYRYEYRILNSADFGAYTSRKRFFGTFAKYDLPIVWPKPTHAKNPKKDLFNSNLARWKPVREVLDFEDEGESIFGRKKPLVDATLERIYSGLIKFVAGGKEAFIVKYNSMSRTGKYHAPSIDDPCPTVATQGRLGLAQVRFIQQRNGGNPDSKVISVDQPARTLTATGGNQEVVSAHFLSKYYVGSPEGKNVSIEEPAGAITTREHHSFISAYYGNGHNHSIASPAPTLTTKDRLAFVTCEPWIMNTSFRNVGSSIDDPAQTITANRKWHYLMNPQFQSAGGSITPAMVKIKEFMALYGIVDIKMRMLRIPELKQIMGFPKDYKLIGTQEHQKKFIGNAVEVNMSRVLCEALCARLIELNTKPLRTAA